ncbi:MAG TPA: hypothetical protein VFP91_22465 [Vicinamibacterales bacterium]|nr:hypothetical protein [Vicinamibacterales bacterium]
MGSPAGCIPALQFRTSKESRISPNLKRDWVPTRRAFDRLLVWLDDGVDSAGQGYLDMRRRLVRYFERKRCVDPDHLADDTLNRVMRRLQEEGTITAASPAQYCHIVAKFVLLEYVRQGAQTHARQPLPADWVLAVQTSGQSDSSQSLHDCLERCLGELEPDEALLILEYYQGEQRAKIERRRRLAVEFDLSPNALSIRACRIRDKLEACINRCRAGRERETIRGIPPNRDE